METKKCEIQNGILKNFVAWLPLPQFCWSPSKIFINGLTTVFKSLKMQFGGHVWTHCVSHRIMVKSKMKEGIKDGYCECEILSYNHGFLF